MAIITRQNKVIPKLTSLSPYEIYLQQVKGAYDGIRASSLGVIYYPPQLGGFFGQLQVMDEIMVLELTSFQID